jgi:hypothetical protein
VPLLEIFRAIVRDPHFAAGIFPNQGFEREIDGDGGRSDHDRSARFGTAKKNQLRGLHLQADLFCFPAVIDPAKYGQPLFFQYSFHAFESFGNRVWAAQVLHSVIGSGFQDRPPETEENIRLRLAITARKQAASNLSDTLTFKNAFGLHCQILEAVGAFLLRISWIPDEVGHHSQPFLAGV